MSVAGPRPEVFEVVDNFLTYQWDRLLSVRPGLTCLLQIDVYPEFRAAHGDVGDPFRYYVEEQLPYKLKRDLDYMERASFGLDLKIIAQTVHCILARSFSFLSYARERADRRTLEPGGGDPPEQAGRAASRGRPRFRPVGELSARRLGGKGPSAHDVAAVAGGGTMPLTVLRTAAGSPVAPFVIRALKRVPDIRVVAVDSDPLSCGFAFADRHHVVPRVDAERFLETMLEICREESVDLLLSDLDEELALLSAARDRFLTLKTRVVVSTPDVIEECTDKYRTSCLFRRLGIPTPQT
jgi:PylC-like, N-terminal domain/Bacterial sugar transferase